MQPSFTFFRSIKNKPCPFSFKKEHGRGPTTDSEIDQVYGKGAADKAYGDAMMKEKIKTGPRNRR